MTERLFHIVPRETWTAAREAGTYRPHSLDAEGFVHFSYAHQVQRVHEARYRDVPDLVVVEIDRTKVDADLKVEDSYGAGEEFPHLYGEIPTAAEINTFAIDDPLFSADGSATPDR